VNGCDTTFQSDFEALRAAGIVVVFAAGNSGPNPATSVSPANNGDGFAAGAVDDAGAIADFSSRGASACDGGIFPDLVAPGVNVLTSSLSLGGVPQYTYVEGTSFAAPHVAAVAALLVGALRPLAVADVEETLRATAHDLGAAGPDDAFGYGLVDAAAAYAALSARAPLVITSASPLASARVGSSYAQTLAGSGGARPYTWSIGAGALPPGLALAGATGVLAGAPTSCGTYAFTVGLRDARGAATSKPLSLTVVE
jgi:subtilisin family serine protease